MPGVNSRSYSITLGAIPGLRGTGNFSHRTANHWPEQGIRASTKVGPRLGLRGEIANAHHAGFSAAIGDAGDLAPMGLFRRKPAAGGLGVQERGRGWDGDGHGAPRKDIGL